MEKFKLSTRERLLLNKVKSYFPDGLHKIGPNSDELFIVLNQAPLNEDDMKDCIIYIITQLQPKNYKVKFIEPFYLYIGGKNTENHYFLP